MTNISRSTISIRFFGALLDPAYITQKLGCSPTFAAKTGESIIKANGKEHVAKKGFWRLEYGESNAVVLEDKITFLLEKLTNNLDAWREVCKNVETADVFCGLFVDKWNEGFSLTSSTMKKLSERGLKIGFDIYSPTELWNDEKVQAKFDNE